MADKFVMAGRKIQGIFPGVWVPAVENGGIGAFLQNVKEYMDADFLRNLKVSEEDEPALKELVHRMDSLGLLSPSEVTEACTPEHPCGACEYCCFGQA